MCACNTITDILISEPVRHLDKQSAASERSAQRVHRHTVARQKAGGSRAIMTYSSHVKLIKMGGGSFRCCEFEASLKLDSSTSTAVNNDPKALLAEVLKG